MEAIKLLRKKSFEQRRTLTDELLETYPNCIPVIIDRYDKTDPEIKKHKYLCNMTDEIGTLLSIIRKQMICPLSSGESLFIFTEKNHTLVCPNTIVGTLHGKYADKDKFLYLCYAKENTFGTVHQKR